MITSIKELPVFDTIHFGNYAKPEDLLTALKLASCGRTEFGEGCFHKITLSAPQKLELVLLSLEELGFSEEEGIFNISSREDDVDYAKVMSAGLALGLGLCPQDTAARIRLRYVGKPSEAPIIPIMIPIISETVDQLPLIFRLFTDRDGRNILGSRFVCSRKNGLERGSKCLFVRPLTE